jgi:hypothetical protein
MVSIIDSQNGGTTAANPAPQNRVASRLGSFFSSFVSSSFQNMPGSRTFTRAIAEQASEILLPESGVYRQPIEVLTKRLDDITGSTILSETCRYFALFAQKFLEHHITKAQEMDHNQRCGFVEELFQNRNSQNPEYGATGEIFRTVLTSRPELVQEVAHLNLLKVFCSLVTNLQKLASDNPFWLVDFVREAQESALTALNAPRQGTRADIWPILRDKITGALVAIALPKGAEDIELPLPGQRFFQSWLYDMLKGAMLPKILNYCWNNSTSDYCRDNSIANLISKFQEFLVSAPENGSSTSTAASRPYPHKEAFTQGFKAFLQKFATSIDPKLGQTLASFPANRFLGTMAETLIGKLSGIDITALLNSSFETILPALNDAALRSEGGTWVEEGGRKKFHDVPDVFFTKDSEEAAYNAKQAERQREVQSETTESIEGVSRHYSTLADTISSRIITMPKQAEQDRIINSGSLFEKIVLTWRYLLQTILSCIFGAILFFVGDSYIKNNIEAVFRKSLSCHLKDLFQPVGQTLANKITA